MKYGRFLILTVAVILVELAISLLLAQKYNLLLLDSIFYVGLVFSLLFIFFSRTGGLFSNYSEMKTAASTLGFKNSYKLKRTIGSLSINCFNVGSFLFFLIGLGAAFSL
ncbi:hypothetical protein CEQ21_19130 [Niallia circulans]|uniref:Uncharacterized protein n=1 Tax=Niallia circulans TaxID=1397 RepID=A0A553SKR2_NIACI|nr:hypothetical protein [Niallia circulans]TRZ37562.1 hypothetical protein CEQ21_19130 [Niallia circulans]